MCVTRKTTFPDSGFQECSLNLFSVSLHSLGLCKHMFSSPTWSFFLKHPVVLQDGGHAHVVHLLRFGTSVWVVAEAGSETQSVVLLLFTCQLLLIFARSRFFSYEKLSHMENSLWWECSLVYEGGMQIFFICENSATSSLSLSLSLPPYPS